MTLTVLVVDDVADNIHLLSEVLKPFYRVKAAKSGEKALAIANKAEKPDLILLDVMMPQMSGFETIARLKDNPDTKDIPVIFVTAKHEKVDQEQGLQLGAVDYLTKPIDPENALAVIAEHIQ